MRSWVLGMCLASLAVTGCSHSHDRPVARSLHPCPAAGQRADLASALLFDPRPGRYNASDIAARSDWPSANAFYSPGEVIFFRERFIDFQGRGFDASNYTYRRFDTYRIGTGYR